LKGQSSLEFLSFVALSSLMLAILYGVVMDQQREAVQYQVDRNSERILEKVSFEVEMALVQGDGYSRVFSVPESVAGYGYEVKLFDGRAVLEYDDEKVIGSSRYRGDEISINTTETNVFRVINDEGKVSLQEK